MTDNEIIERLNKADNLLKQYKELLSPVLAELANRKTQSVGIAYRGEFGCWESGINTLCIHLDVEDDGRPDFSSAYDWEMQTNEALFGGLEHIHLSGFY